MLKLRIIQPGQKDRTLQIDSDEAILGRAPGCDVTVTHSCVSKRHVKLMAGVLVIDLESSNGTSVDGQRIHAPTLLRGHSFRLGGESSDVEVQVEVENPDVESSPAYLSLREDLDQERRSAAELKAELAALREADSGTEAHAESELQIAELRRERDDLARRLESLRGEIEARDVEASANLQTKLAGEALAEAKRSNESLLLRVEELESQASGPMLEAAKKALTQRVGELEADLVESEETTRRLRKELEELEAAAEPVPMGSDLFFKLQAENLSLRKELEAASSAATGTSPDLFVSLQTENQALQARIAELEASAVQTPAPVAPEAGADELQDLKRENHDLRLVKTDLTQELELLRSKVQTTKPAPASMPTIASGGEAITDLLTSLAAQDIDHRPALVEGPLAPFVTLELFRFLRMTERLVTRMAGGFLQLFDQRTILPDTEGNVRALLSAVLVTPKDPEVRTEFVAYVEELGRWLVVAIGANRRAAERFAEELKSELSERNLVADDPIPKLKKIAGMQDAELWQRVAKRLKRLTPDVIEERLEKLTSTCAEELRREQNR